MERLGILNNLGIFTVNRIGPVDPSFDIQTKFNEHYFNGIRVLRPSIIPVSDETIRKITDYTKQGYNKVLIITDNNTLRNRIKM